MNMYIYLHVHLQYRVVNMYTCTRTHSGLCTYTGSCTCMMYMYTWQNHEGTFNYNISGHASTCNYFTNTHEPM